ncbi:MAG: element-mobilizing transposase RayT [Acidobacteria bacterium]|nr:element-mobilizing transposase RayT [Acidobacteriota bacterium]
MLADSFGTRRHLPHIERADKTYFVTFATRLRDVLSDRARDTVLETIVKDHQVSYWLRAVVVMPDHVHAILTPLESWRMSAIMQRMKGVSAHRVNRSSGRRGRVWEGESFDRILRAGANLEQKTACILDNPVRAGLVVRFDDYAWLWREWIEGKGSGEASPLARDDPG